MIAIKVRLNIARLPYAYSKFEMQGASRCQQVSMKPINSEAKIHFLMREKLLKLSASGSPGTPC
jgi:hypothetical protein